MISYSLGLTSAKLSHHLRREAKLPAPLKSSAKATCLTLLSDLMASIIGVIPMAYTGIARGSPCVVPSDYEISVPPRTNKRDGVLQQFRMYI